MILSASIKNFLGIKNFDVDFLQTHTYNKGQDEQILSCEDINYSLLPTFLSKNATGKTSLVKAISFGLIFSNHKEFTKEIEFYIKSSLRKEEFFSETKFSNSKDVELFLLDLKKQLIHKIISSLFNELSYTDSKEIYIKLKLIKHREIKIKISEDHFLIKLNNSYIDVALVINEIISHFIEIVKNKKIDNNFHLLMIINKKLNFVIEKVVSKFNFYTNVNFNSIFRDTSRQTMINELLIKTKVDKYILELANYIGFESVETLLKKLDDKIIKISFDVETKVVNIFIKDSSLPISGKNLSFGTQKVLEILYKSMPLFREGGIMLVDEIENGLHFSLIQLIVSLFEEERINQAKAQLLLTTHNPLIFEKRIVLPSNAFIIEKNNFKNLKSFTDRTYDFKKFIKSKNYYNDFFWAMNNKESRSTISDIAMTQIINSFENGLYEKNKIRNNC